jgi:hypothetical protein
LKPTTKYWGKFESKGYPNSTVTTGLITNNEMMRKIAYWLLEVKMNDKIIITLAVDESKLSDTGRKSERVQSIESFFDQLETEIPEAIIEE